MALRALPLNGSPDLVETCSVARDAGLEAVLMERPMPDAVSVAGLGVAADLVGDPGGASILDPDGGEVARVDGDDSLLAVADLWRELCSRGSAEGPLAMAIGGFSFRRDRVPATPWEGFPAVQLRVPRLALVRRRGRTTAIAATLTRAGETTAQVDLRLAEALELLGMPRVGYTAPAARTVEVDPVRSPASWMAMVVAAAARLSAGEAEKVVLAREVLARADGVVSAGAVLRALRSSYPSCFTFLVAGADGTALVGASPELLVRRDGTQAMSQPMAGSAARGVDELDDARIAATLQASTKDRREHALVVEGMAAALRPLALSVDVPPGPEVVQFTNIQHLATTITAALRPSSPAGVLELCAAVHPTAAIAGHPRQAALALLDELEGMERGWYGGAVGWVNGNQDGEFALALRCGLLWEDGARVFAGVGVMPDSNSAAELAETEMKLRPLLGALSA
ncbi:MAG: isochorismate synthase [Candidatus Dormibacteria bacterium]